MGHGVLASARFVCIIKSMATATQLITPNPEISCRPGWCLEYVRETFNLPAKYPSATASWEASEYKHTDKEFPDNVSVPVWYSLGDEPDGHVALRQPDGTVWSASHPTDTTPVHHESMQDIETYYGGRLGYLGWTEDLSGELVIDLDQSSIPAPVVGGVAQLEAVQEDDPRSIVLTMDNKKKRRTT